MRKLIPSCALIGLILLSARANSATVLPAPTMASTSQALTPTDTASRTPAPTATNTPPPLTHLDLWLTIEDDPTAPPIGKIKSRTVNELYIWAKVPQGAAGDFILRATLQDGTQDQLGPTFHALPDGQVIDCGFWNGGFLNARGIVKLEAYAGDLLIGSFVFSIN